jgi:hypothetical protein
MNEGRLKTVRLPKVPAGGSEDRVLILEVRSLEHRLGVAVDRGGAGYHCLARRGSVTPTR